jgi:hypothetical protein
MHTNCFIQSIEKALSADRTAAAFSSTSDGGAGFFDIFEANDSVACFFPPPPTLPLSWPFLLIPGFDDVNCNMND